MDDVQNVTCDVCVSNLLWANLTCAADEARAATRRVDVTPRRDGGSASAAGRMCTGACFFCSRAHGTRGARDGAAFDGRFARARTLIEQATVLKLETTQSSYSVCDPVSPTDIADVGQVCFAAGPHDCQRSVLSPQDAKIMGMSRASRVHVLRGTRIDMVGVRE